MSLTDLIATVATELSLGRSQVAAAVALFDDGNTIPFVARYRKEATGELDEEQLRQIDDRVTYLRRLADRKAAVLKSIDEQGKLTTELATAIQYKLPIKIIILNNQYLGMVRQWQELFYERRYAATDIQDAPDFVKLAESYGGVGLRATRPEEVVPVLKEGLGIPRLAVMEFAIDREECVYPMVPAGAPITEMLLV